MARPNRTPRKPRLNKKLTRQQVNRRIRNMESRWLNTFGSPAPANLVKQARKIVEETGHRLKPV